MNPAMPKLLGVVAVLAVIGITTVYVTRTKNAAAPTTPSAGRSQMSFFVTSVNPGKGADLGGLAGADRYCQTLAATVGADDRTWRAYLSTVATDTEAAVNARDRIGAGPWQNANGVVVAKNVEELHGLNNLIKETALTERGEPVSGRGDSVNMHDILTGSLPDGRVSSAEGDTTCRNWTSSTDGSALLGHHDRRGLDESDAAKSWNSSHPSRGCSQEALKGTGGAGLFYCFATGN
jgi:hypothetical protein